ncbi:hypothetical protein [Yersinia sp. 1652 StPb PI]|uniref:hypothetical protein n=1 Tax=Yersinia sp. 1652 StPb PI TaxID=3061649 RepID=UPI00355BC0C9
MRPSLKNNANTLDLGTVRPESGVVSRLFKDLLSLKCDRAENVRLTSILGTSGTDAGLSVKIEGHSGKEGVQLAAERNRKMSILLELDIDTHNMTPQNVSSTLVLTVNIV